MQLNLAERPFVNRQPVRRVSALFLVLGVTLALVNGFLYWRHWAGQGAAETGLEDLGKQVEQERQLLDQAMASFEGFDAEVFNSKVDFVNRRILQRTFSWSRLFDEVVEAMPNDVRLVSLAPRFEDRDRRTERRALADGSENVKLDLQGDAKTSEALLEFVDRLFSHEAFEEPDLHRENLSPDGFLQFSITVAYKARRPDGGNATSAELAE